MDSFFLMGARPLVEGSPSMKLHELLDWGAIAAQLKGLYQREISGAGGPEPYSPLGMFKLMLLGQWHGLSDAQLEQALRVRLDFMVFTGFEPSAGELPDASTICRFRNRLVKAELDQKLLPILAKTLEGAGDITVVHGDILQVDIETLMQGASFKAVANLPYYITTPIILKLLESRLPIER